ncbi:MAG: DMT family transporter [Comamonas sp.]
MNRMNRRASIGWMLAAVLAFAVFDALTKYLAAIYPVVFLVWARYLIHTLVAVAVFFPAHGGAMFRSQRMGAQVVRGLLMLGVSLCMMNGAKYLPLAELTSLYFTAPLIATVLTFFFLKEKVSGRVWGTTFMGVIGVLLITRPGHGDFELSWLLPLMAALLYAGFQIFTRMFATTENPVVTNVMTGGVGAMVMSFVVPFFWSVDSMSFEVKHIILLGALGLSGFLAQFMLIKAYEGGSPASLAPFSYTQLVWSAVIGFLVFGAEPSLFALSGMLVIMAGGVYVILGSRGMGRR